MRFGMFVPQGWRLDLAGIAPADQWSAMRDLAQAADNLPFESIWVYDHFHTVPVPTREETHEAWTLMSAFAAATTRVGSARCAPAWVTGTLPTSPRSRPPSTSSLVAA